MVLAAIENSHPIFLLIGIEASPAHRIGFGTCTNM